MATDPIHLFLNPAAARGRAGKRQTRILELLEQSDLEIVLHRSHFGRDLETRVQHEVNAGTSRILVAGGDGSIHEAVNGVMAGGGGGTAIGIIPTGTGNDFAKACGIPLNWEHATRLLADRLVANETPRKIDIGQFNDRYFVNGAGIGFDAKVTRIAQSIRLPIGDLVYLLAVFRTLMGKIASPNLQMAADDFSWDGPITLAAISNGPWVGGMFHISPMADNADEILELLIAEPVTRRRILSLIPKIMNGAHMQEAEVSHRSLSSVSITSSAPIPSHLDGEVQPLQMQFDIKVLPGVLNLL